MKSKAERKPILSSITTNKTNRDSSRDNSRERPTESIFRDRSENTRTNVEREEMIDDHERDMKRLTR
jgi:hypothetical protein